MDNKLLWEQARELVGEQELSRRYRVWIRGLIKKELGKRSESDSVELSLDEAISIVSDLNTLTKRAYRASGDTGKLIAARLAEGYSVEDFKAVHRAMCARWLEDMKMRDYLRPSTLYRGIHFAEYLALAPVGVGVPADNADRNADYADKKNTEKSRGEAEKAERILVERLLGRKWWEFESWAEFLRWTIQLPDAQAVARYEMPERIRRMRQAPGMVMSVLKGRSPEWAENEYQVLKRDRTQMTQKKGR